MTIMVSSIQTLQPLITLFPLILFIYFLYKWLALKQKLPPSPLKLPIIGNLHQLGTHPHRSLHSLSERYGELMLLHLGSTPYLIVSSARIASEIMKTHEGSFANRPVTEANRRFTYNCKDIAAAPYGEYWRQMKSICVLQLLSNKRVRSFHSVRKQEISILTQIISHSTPSPVNLSDLLKDFTTDVICKVAFGRKYREDEEGTDFKKLMKVFMELVGCFKVGDFVPWLAWINKFNGWEAKIEKTAKELDRFLEQVVQEHEHRQESQIKGEPSDSDDEVKDFVDVLLDNQKDKAAAGFSLERDGIKGLILDMFLGGNDTTSSALEWAMTELLRHPRVMEKLQKEVRGITGEKLDVQEDDMEQMKYLHAVMKETLRLYPSIPTLVPRLSTQEAKIKGYDIAAGTSVIINAWTIQRDPASWDEPEKYNPDRFLQSDSDIRGQDFQLIPFGAGRRMCPGISFAMVMNEFVLANLVHKFDWSLPGGVTADTLDMSECVGLTIHRKTPLLAVATACQFKK